MKSIKAKKRNLRKGENVYDHQKRGDHFLGLPGTYKGMNNIHKNSDILTAWFDPLVLPNKILKWFFLISTYGSTLFP